ncbi:hypothetical protein Tco_0777186 [Tanacetum coccineum]
MVTIINSKHNKHARKQSEDKIACNDFLSRSGISFLRLRRDIILRPKHVESCHNDQDSLNSAAGGNFLDKRPADCSSIIESKSKVRHSRSKAIVAKVSTSASTSGVSPDVAELKDMVRALLLDKQTSPAPAPTPVKAVEQSCVTCGGAHSYRNCPTTNSNNYRDNIQEYVSQAAAANFNQGNSPVTVRHCLLTKSDHTSNLR